MVISIAMLTAGSDPAGYYLARRAGCAAEYYTGAGERAGVWLGRGAAAAGLAGELDGEGERVLRALLDGRAPDGRVLVAPVLRADPRGRLPARPLVDAIRAEADRRGLAVEDSADRGEGPGRVHRPGRQGRPAAAAGRDGEPGAGGTVAAAAGLDPHAVYRVDHGNGAGTTDRTEDGPDNRSDNLDRYATALAHAGQRVDVRRPGIDVTVSAPKSVSVLYALGDPDDRGGGAGRAPGRRRPRPRATSNRPQGTGCAATRATGSAPNVSTRRGGSWRRSSTAPPAPGDPQLHTHLVVPNLLRGADGKWSAVDSKAVYRHALTASYLYHAVLRGELTARLGVAWTTPEKGIAEVARHPHRPDRHLLHPAAADPPRAAAGGAVRAGCGAGRVPGHPTRQRPSRAGADPAGAVGGHGPRRPGTTRPRRRWRPRPRPPAGRAAAASARRAPARPGRTDGAGHRVRPPRPAAGPVPGPAARHDRGPGLGRGCRRPGAGAP